jgi:hypothetical protein
LVGFGATEQIFLNPLDNRTRDYVAGRCGQYHVGSEILECEILTFSGFTQVAY